MPNIIVAKVSQVIVTSRDVDKESVKVTPLRPTTSPKWKKSNSKTY